MLRYSLLSLHQTLKFKTINITYHVLGTGFWLKDSLTQLGN